MIPLWEVQSNFDPLGAKQQTVTTDVFRTLVDQQTTYAGTWSKAEHVLSSLASFDLLGLPLRDPTFFRAGQLSSNLTAWEDLLSRLDPSEGDMIKSWLRDGVNVEDFFQEFKGQFKGIELDSKTPPVYYQENSISCKSDPDLIARTLEERIKNGSIELLGKWDQVQSLPVCIMPLTLEVTKGRLCHDERFLNLFIKDAPFKLDTLQEVPRITRHNDFLIGTDEKSGYDHVFLSESSRSYFGLSYAGWVMRYCTLPFGFKAACFIYQTIGMVLTSYFREMGVPSLQYIDDRLFVLAPPLNQLEPDDWKERIIYSILELMTRLGYTLSLHKCTFTPTRQLRYLGFIIDTENGSFKLPQDKQLSFSLLRESLLERRMLDLRSLQKFSGKCVSMSIAIPGALFFIRETNYAISQAYKNSRLVPLTGKLRQELEFWRFLDSWEGQSKWRDERHVTLHLATDASQFRWAGILLDENAPDQPVSDYFGEGDDRAIHLKETQALINTIESLSATLQNARLYVKTDNKALEAVWKRQGSKRSSFNELLIQLFQLTVKHNLDLHLDYINTKENPADAPSRLLTRNDCMLAVSVWEEIESKFGPHSVDLMSLDSNVMKDYQQQPLRHFTPWSTPLSAGVDIFAQEVERELNPYVHPPECMIAPLLSFLEERRVPCCTVVLPSPVPKLAWWPKVMRHAVDQLILGHRGDRGILVVPSPQGWTTDTEGLKYDLFAVRMGF